jgi:uncharacterized protein (TIGR03083 family)
MEDDIEWAAEYEAARLRIGHLLAAASADDAATKVPACPAWTVRDLLAHVTGLAAALSSGQLPGADQQAWLDGLVAARSHRSIGELLDEWAGTGPGIAVFFAHMGGAGSQLVYDVVAHEHDMRHALGRPGDQHSSGVVACATAMSNVLARDLAAHDLPAVQVTSAGRTWNVGEGAPELVIALDPFELIRVFGGRRSVAQLRALPWQGDLDRYLSGLAHAPFPIDDLVE